MADQKEVEEVKDVKEAKEKTVRSAPVRNYTDLLVYKQAYRLALEISKLTRTFPGREQYELGRQLRASSRKRGSGWTWPQMRGSCQETDASH